MRKLWIALLDWAAKKLDESAVRIMETDLKKDVPAPKTPPGASRLLPDGHFAAPETYDTWDFDASDQWPESYIERAGLSRQLDFNRIQSARLDGLTPDHPQDPIRQEIDALTGKAEAVNYPRGS